MSTKKRVMTRGLLTLALVLGILTLIVWFGTRSTVYIVNGFSFPLTVVVDGEPPVVIQPHSGHDVPRRIGPHVVETTFPQGDPQVVRFWITPVSFFTSTHVVNPGSGGVLYKSQVRYSDLRFLEPAAREFLVGESLYVIQGIDYPFDAPESIEVSAASGAVSISRTKLSMWSSELGSSLSELEKEMSHDALMTLVETHLTRNSKLDKQLLWSYAYHAETIGESDRRDKFLRTHGFVVQHPAEFADDK